MKKIFKYILTIILILPVFISATSFDNAKKLVNDYYKNFDTFSNYFRTDLSLPFEFDGSNKVKSGFVTGGMISKTEYNLTTSNGAKSYLFDGIKFWEIDGGGIDKNTPNAKTKATEFTRTDVKVKGVGTYTDPWRFNDVYKVTLRSNGNGYIEQTGKLSYTKVADNGSNIVFSIVNANGYKYVSNDCGSYASYDESRNQLLIQNINKNIMCSVTFGVSNYAHSLPTVRYTVNNPNSGVHECVFENPVPQSFYAQYRQGYFKDSSLSEHLGHVTPPYRRGWTFNGYYVGEKQLINPNGDFTSDYTLISSLSDVITFKATENTYKVTFDVVKHNVGSTSGTLGTTSINATFDHDPNNITIPSKPGYTFEGYYLEGKFTGSGDNTKYYDGSGKSIHYWDEDSDTVLYANWTPKQYTITFDKNDPAASLSDTTRTVTFDAAYGDLPIPTKTGYNLEGWYTEPTGGTKVTASTIDRTVGNHTLYARYIDNIPPTCSITKTSTGGEGGVSLTVTCSDAGTGCATAPFNDSGVKSNKTYSVYDNMGNQGTCTVSVSGYDCNPYQYVCGSYVCGSYACGSYACGSYACGSRKYQCNCGFGMQGNGCDTCSETTYCTSYCTSYCDSYCDSYCTGYKTCYR